MDFKTLFYPQSVAVIGASSKEDTVGNDLVKNIVESYKGKIFLVNLKQEVICGLKSYANISNIQDKIDLAVIAVPAQAVPTVLEESGKQGIKAAVIISAGFKEVGRGDLEDEIIKIAKEFDIALIGPNCLGFINPEAQLNASFAVMMPSEGPVAFVSQSGALCTAVLDYAKYYNLGFSKFVSIGNKAVVDEVDLLKYLFKDEKTKVIAMYLESLNNPDKLLEIMKDTVCNKQKPVIVIKSGRTTAGASASLSHTGALGGSDNAYEALFRQAGIIRVDSVEDMFNLIRVFCDNEPAAAGGVAVITNAGGPGVLATDELIKNNLALAKLSEDTVRELKGFLPAAASVKNPIDVLGDAQSETYAAALEAVIKDENVNSIMVILTPQSMTEIKETAREIGKIKDKTLKPIVVTFMGESTVEAGVKILQKEDVAAVNFPEQAAKALAIVNQYYNSCHIAKSSQFDIQDVDKQAVETIFKNAGTKVFPEVEAIEILQKYGFKTLKSKIVISAEEAKANAPEIGSRLAMKIISEDILHKTDVGGVRLDIRPDEVEKNYSEMMEIVRGKCPNAKLDGILLMEMAPKDGFEFILGSTKDPALGNMIMFGLGGIFVEILKDIAFGLAPINKQDAQKMLGMIKSKKIFEGVRGRPALDTDALIDCLGRLSKLLDDFPNIKELDINPLLVLPKGQGVVVLDGRIILE